jgi:hypothetical protein
MATLQGEVEEDGGEPLADAEGDTHGERGERLLPPGQQEHAQPGGDVPDAHDEERPWQHRAGGEHAEPEDHRPETRQKGGLPRRRAREDERQRRARSQERQELGEGQPRPKPRRDDIRTILIIGSGPIVIGQGCEFDYSGAQACKALRDEGYRVVLVNSNPATIMTDPAIRGPDLHRARHPDAVRKIIEKEATAGDADRRGAAHARRADRPELRLRPLRLGRARASSASR